jgi:hypothetical protein
LVMGRPAADVPVCGGRFLREKVSDIAIRGKQSTKFGKRRRKR